MVSVTRCGLTDETSHRFDGDHVRFRMVVLTEAFRPASRVDLIDSLTTLQGSFAFHIGS